MITPNRLRVRLAALAGTLMVLSLSAFGAAPAQAATTNGFGCHAETLHASILGQDTLRPLVAGNTTGLCVNDDGGAPVAGPAVAPGVLGLDAAYATTRIKPNSLTAPVYQRAEARSGVADARIDANGSVLRVQAVEASSSASCLAGRIAYRSTGHVAKLSVLGQDVPLNDGLSQVITAVDGVTKAIVHIELNETVNTGGSHLFRALHVTVLMDGSVLDAVVAENRLNGVGTPCKDFTGLPGDPPSRPTVGRPWGGGNVVKLKDIPGYKALRKVSLCVRAKRYGRKIAIVGNNKRNKITGSKFADRIFAYGARDTLNGGSGNDCVEGGKGNDQSNGGTGHDVLYGRKGRDYLDGGAGRDRLFGGPGRDLLVTGSRRDRAYGGSGNDRIFTRDGRDRVSGGRGNDRIFADAGGRRDRIRCGPGRDRVRVDPYDKVARDCEIVVVRLGSLGRSR